MKLLFYLLCGVALDLLVEGATVSMKFPLLTGSLLSCVLLFLLKELMSLRPLRYDSIKIPDGRYDEVLLVVQSVVKGVTLLYLSLLLGVQDKPRIYHELLLLNRLVKEVRLGWFYYGLLLLLWSRGGVLLRRNSIPLVLTRLRHWGLILQRWEVLLLSHREFVMIYVYMDVAEVIN